MSRIYPIDRDEHKPIKEVNLDDLPYEGEKPSEEPAGKQILRNFYEANPPQVDESLPNLFAIAVKADADLQVLVDMKHDIDERISLARGQAEERWKEYWVEQKKYKGHGYTHTRE